MAEEVSAGINITDETFIVAVWVAGNGSIDWLSTLLRPRHDAPLELHGRFRFVNDDGVWDTRDEKRWVHATFPADMIEEKALSTAQELAVKVAEEIGAQLHVVTINGGADDFVRAIKDPRLAPWFSSAQGKPGETHEQLVRRARNREKAERRRQRGGRR